MEDTGDGISIHGDYVNMETEDADSKVIQAENVQDCPSRNMSDENVEEKPEPCLKKLHDPFKVPAVLKVKPTPRKLTAGGETTTSVVTTSTDSGVAGATCCPTQVSSVANSQDSPNSGGFAIPNSKAIRPSATPHSQQPRSPALPPSKSSSSDERVGSTAAAAGGCAPAYRPPAWSGCPSQPYSLEVLRGGQIVDTVSLEGRPCVMFGRLPDCDVRLEHPSISRHHAALVYRVSGDDGHEAGYYLYDLDSTHGSTLNKTVVQPKVYCRMRVGHMCKFGGSSRLFILQGPEEDQEQESDLTVTELRELGQKRQQELQERLAGQQERLNAPDDEPEPEPAAASTASPAPSSTSADNGISWGMSEDADEESDLQFNPFALGEAENEQLYLVDPKRTLRGWFEREGHELEYQTEELPGGRHVCRVTLPLDTADGVSPVAEASQVGKKKEAVFQCALEACRMLDRAGLLRQAKQESRHGRRRKPAGYDSDEDDTFLDRTGAVERKRQRRQQAAQAKPKADTYQSLLARYQEVQSEAAAVERRLQQMESAGPAEPPTAADCDELDAFMTRLSQGTLNDRQEKRQLRTRLSQLRSEESRLCRLVNLARPAALPPLKPPPQSTSARSPLTGFIGKRRGKTGAATVPTAPVPARVSTTDLQRPGSADGPPPPREATSEDGRTSAGSGRAVSVDAVCVPELACRGHRGDEPEQTADGEGIVPPVAGSPRSHPANGSRPSAEPKVCGEASPRHFQEDDVTVKPKRQPKGRRPDKQATAVPCSEPVEDDSEYVWMPPEGQSGDGRTSLNDKFGY